MRANANQSWLTIFLLFISASRADDVMTFDWPDKLKAHVAVQVKGKRTTSTGGSYGWNFDGNYTLQADRAGTELLIHRTDFSGWTGDLAIQKAGFMIDRIVDLVPKFSVTTDGDFLRVDEVENARHNFEELFKEFKLYSQQEKSALMNFTTSESISAITQDYWAAMIQAWRNRPASASSETFTNRTAIPQLGGGSVDLKLTLTNFGKVACDKQDKNNSCVSLELRSEPDPAQVALILKQLLSVKIDTRPTKFLQVQLLHLTTKPDTLVPYKLSISRRMEYEMSKDGTLGTGIEENERIYTFTY